MAVFTAACELIILVMPLMDRYLEHDKVLGQRRAFVYRTEVVRGDLDEMGNMASLQIDICQIEEK